MKLKIKSEASLNIMYHIVNRRGVNINIFKGI